MSQGVTSTTFRQAMSRFASGVTIVTARQAEGLVGFTATGFTSVSLSPPLILVSIGKDASAYAGITAAEHFGVSILSEEQSEVAMKFATHGVDRFAGVPLDPPDGAGPPLVHGALARLHCKSFAQHDAGDHTLLVGEVLDAWVVAGEPLLHFDRRFGAFHGHSKK